MTDKRDENRARPGSRKVVLTAVVLGLVALGFYIAAILMQVVSG